MKDTFCAKCGSCTSVCPVYQFTGKETLTARGRIHLLEKLAEEKHSRNYHEIFSKCLLCNACRDSCPRGIDLPAMVIEARNSFPLFSGTGSFKSSLLKSCLEHQDILAGLGGLCKLSAPLRKILPPNSGLHLKLGLIEETSFVATTANHKETDNSADNLQLSIFPGCLARHLKPEITSGVEKLLSSFGETPVTVPQGQVCCGMASYNSGDLETARNLARENITAFGDNDLPIIVPCASCLTQLKDYPVLLEEDDKWQLRAKNFAARITDMSSLMADQTSLFPHLLSGKNRGTTKVLYHTPCHRRHLGSAANAAEKVLAAHPGFELIEVANGSRCCGFGGLFNLVHPKLSDRIAAGLINEIIAADPDIVVTDCSGCLIQLHIQLSARGSRVKVKHFISLLGEA